jgi:hypothetical protein
MVADDEAHAVGPCGLGEANLAVVVLPQECPLALVPVVPHNHSQALNQVTARKGARLD